METKKGTIKASKSETGHSKNVANLETLIIYCTGYGTIYNPSNPSITLNALNILHSQAKDAVKNVKKIETIFNNVEGERKIAFTNVKKDATKIVNALKASGVLPTVIKDAETINRKIQGKRADDSVLKTNQTEGENLEKKDIRSVSQQSFDMQIDHLEKLVELVSFETKYNPNEEHLKVETLTNFVNKLETINSAVKTANSSYKTAMQNRDTILYANETGLVHLAKTVKNYVKSIFGTSSPQYKQVSKISFKNII